MFWWKRFILAFFFSCHLAQAATPAKVDVISVYNGGYVWGQGKNQAREIKEGYSQLSLINSVVGSSARPYFLADGAISGESAYRELVFKLAAPATIESFRVRGEGTPGMPQKVEFAVSTSPQTGFQTIATHVVPEKYRPKTFHGSGEKFDFSIPVTQKVSARYVRLTLRGSHNGSFELRYLNAYGYFNQPAELRKDFSGVYSAFKYEKDQGGTEADTVMASSRNNIKSYIILQQQEGLVQGCYVTAIRDRNDTLSIHSVEGAFAGGTEGNLYRFTRTYAKDGSQRPGVITLSPDGKGGHLAMLNEIKPGDKGDGYYRVALTRVSDQPIPCSANAEKEKTPVDAMEEAIAKTGKVQLYGVNFDFDSDVLRPESGVVLDEVVKLAKANPNWKFEIGGHTDSQGSDTYNQNLSERRAASVVRYLTQAGVAASRLTAKGYGESRPLIPETGDSEAARAQNRRVELVKQ